MNRKNLIGSILAVGVLLPAILMSGDVSLYLNPAGLLLVLGGTLTGVFLAYPMETIRGLWGQLKDLGRDSVMSQPQIIALFVDMARQLRREGVRALEKTAQESGNQFLEMGVALVADDRRPEDVRERLEQEFDFFMARREAEVAVLSLMGRLAPALGLAGTVVGMIRMLHALKDPGSVASGMSVALLTTFYGVLVANLLVLPLERKLRERSRAEGVAMALVTEGVMGLAAEENGAAMQARLGSFRFAQAPAAASRPGKAAHSWLRNFKGLTVQTGSVGHDR
jgi:chemotaxis protein MotA